jgi:hypothetical protein
MLFAFLVGERGTARVSGHELSVKKLPFTPAISILYLVKRIQFNHFRGLGVSEARVEFETKKFLSALTVAIPVLPDYVALARVGLEALQASAEAADVHG